MLYAAVPVGLRSPDIFYDFIIIGGFPYEVLTVDGTNLVRLGRLLPLEIETGDLLLAIVSLPVRRDPPPILELTLMPVR